MDVLKPPVLWLEGKCYRVPVPIKRANNERDMPASMHYEEDVSCCIGGESDSGDNDDFEVDMTEGGRYRTVFCVPRTFFACLIGPKGTVRRRLEEETNTQIRIPSKTQIGDIVVTGRFEKDVKSARLRMNLIVAAARQKQTFTHFFSIPMTGTQIKNNFAAFKEEVCGNMTASNGIDPLFFQNPDKLHLTLGIMVLGDESECTKVTEMFQHFKETYVDPILENKPLRIRMVGVECMNDDPQEVNILYGKVCLADGTDSLQQLADKLSDHFYKQGFVVKKYDHVKLHVTLMNTFYREKKNAFYKQDNASPKRKPRKTFDATEIMKTFDSFEFGEQSVDAIHLSQRHTAGADGYYQMTSCINL